MKKTSLLLYALLGTATLAPLAIPTALAAPAPTYTSKADGYAVYLPGKPTEASRPMAMPALGQSTIKFISVRKGPLTFIVIPIKLPAAPKGKTIDQFFDGVQNGFTQSTGAKLLSSKIISINGAPGREILVQTPNSLLRGRFFVKGSRSYQIVAISPKVNSVKYTPQVMQVLDSFRIL